MATIFGWFVDTVIVADPSASQEDSASTALNALEGSSVDGTNFISSISATTNVNGWMEDADTDESTFGGAIGNSNTGSEFTFGGMTKTVDEFVNFGDSEGGAPNTITYDGVQYPVDTMANVQVALFTDGTYMVLFDDAALSNLASTLGVTELDPNKLSIKLGQNEDGAGTTRTYATSPSNYDNVDIFAASAATPVPDGVVNGTETNDTMGVGYTDTNGDQITSGDDVIDAGGGNDMIDAGAGNDVIYSGAGSDTITGGLGDDVVNLAAGGQDSYIMDNGGGNDSIGGFELPLVDSFGNAIASVDVIDARGMVNSSGMPVQISDLTVTADVGGNAVINFPNGETITLKSITPAQLTPSVLERAVLVQGGAAGNGLVDGADAGQIMGVGFTDGDGDQITDGNDTIYGNGGDDTIDGGDGVNNIDGGLGNDTFILDDGTYQDKIIGGDEGGDTDSLDAGTATGNISMTFTGDETGTANIGATGYTEFYEIERVNLGSGNDTVDASATTTGIQLSSGAGDDSILGGSGDDAIDAGTGSDTVQGGAGNDSITLGPLGDGNDVLVMGDGDGNDTVTGFDMPIDNGDGTYTPVDLLDLSGLTDAGGAPVDASDVSVSGDGLGNTLLSFPNGESILLMGVDPVGVTPAVLTAMGVPAPAATPDGVVDGTDTGETMNGGYVDADGDQIDNSGNVIMANGGDDTVYGGTGDDTIDGGAGQDWIFAGDGNDLASGGADNDSIWGDLGNDTLYGNDGDDKLIGGGGDDLLTGGTGNDLLYGDDVFGDTGGWASTDTPEPNFGNDTLVLDGGDDTAYGGSGDDTFQIFDGFGNDQIIGGEAGEVVGDTIDGTSLNTGVNVTYSGDETGTISDGSATIDFVEIENLDLGSGDDTVQVLTSTTGTVNGSDGFDTLDLPVGAPGDPAPVVTVTSETPYTGTGFPGATTKSGYVDFPDGSRMYFENFEEILCFTPGMRIDTMRGLVAVEDLQPGDRVLTRDNGYQPLAWTGRRDLSAAEVARCPAVAPVRIAAGALGRGLPERDLVVSPRHRMLITGARAELMFGEREVLVAAADLLGLPGVQQDAVGPVSYIHVMCDSHEIIRAEGAWSESFQPAEAVLNALDTATREELLGLFPALGTEAGRQGFAAARPVLSGAEAKVLFAA